MSRSDPPSVIDAYVAILTDYFSRRDEEVLERAALLSQRFIDEGMGPDEIVALHRKAVEIAENGTSSRKRGQSTSDAVHFLLEVLIAYGVQYRSYFALRLRERDHESEASLAVERQRVVDAERSEREKEEILATISHELRTPLTAALGNVDLARRHLDRGNVERLSGPLTSARAALGRLARLTDDLVDASRGTPSSVTLAPIDVGSVLGQACTWAQPLAAEKGVTLIVGPCDNCESLAGSDGLQAVFSNLLSNAIRYTPAGGRVEAHCSVDDGSVLVSVADTGIGIPDDVRQRIFERFFRAPNAKQAEPRGLGLGLSIALRQVHTYGGSLDVESRPGGGSVFRVRLPRSKQTSC